MDNRSIDRSHIRMCGTEPACFGTALECRTSSHHLNNELAGFDVDLVAIAIAISSRKINGLLNM